MSLSKHVVIMGVRANWAIVMKALYLSLDWDDGG